MTNARRTKVRCSPGIGAHHTVTGRGDELVRTDADLLQATTSDPEAFGLFFDRHYDNLLGYFFSRVRSPDAAADLCAETLAAALDGVRRFDPGLGSATGWLYGIAHHKLSRYWRDLRVSRDARDRLAVAEVRVDLGTAAAFSRAEARADRDLLFAALGRLPSDQAAAVRLRVLDELRYPEIALRLGCGEGTARVRVHRGLKRLEVEFGAK